MKRLLKKYKYPPEEAEDAKNVVLKQCEQWAENEPEMATQAPVIKYDFNHEPTLSMVADDSTIQQ